MKNFYFLVICLLFAACAKDPAPEAPLLEVTLGQAEYSPGQDVKFNLKTASGLITFYSGEVGNDYTFKTGRIVEKGDLSLKFASNVNNGTQQNQFSVLVSTDFKGIPTIEQVKAATWTDVTSRVTLATNATFVNTSANLTDLVVDGKPIYIAFRYTTAPQAANGKQRTWTVNNLTLKSNTSIGLVDLGDNSNSGFQLINEGAVDPGRSSVSTSAIILRGNDVNTEARTVTWAISKGFDAGKADKGPDKGLPVKSYLDAEISSYTYRYSKPGTYKATFVAANFTIYGNKEVVKTIDVTVK
ncbi:DUF5017 domain-containing protein [Pedobacter nutrimenti]|uniref:Uncharacterized protein DUF5017 n=1 Tax=Pedobacter nutrimenti TaxID=1241337 RepID=A0A318U862_9SPHI|nr:DUF5017 domain-containing protein [Pedobacter nutrimenti]PYF70631.1 uncharacterized protein DUF5017 [Pedobacter nutrimenti]